MTSDSELLRQQVDTLTNQINTLTEKLSLKQRELDEAYESSRTAGVKARQMKQRNDELTADVFELTKTLMDVKRDLPDDVRRDVEKVLAKDPEGDHGE